MAGPSTSADMRVNDTSYLDFVELSPLMLSFTDRGIDVVEKQFLRCDMTEECAFLVTRLSPHYDR